MFGICFPNDPPQCHKKVRFVKMKLHKSERMIRQEGESFSNKNWFYIHILCIPRALMGGLSRALCPV